MSRAGEGAVPREAMCAYALPSKITRRISNSSSCLELSARPERRHRNGTPDRSGRNRTSLRGRRNDAARAFDCQNGPHVRVHCQINTYRLNCEPLLAQSTR
jgi:hypothetical protein